MIGNLGLFDENGRCKSLKSYIVDYNTESEQEKLQSSGYVEVDWTDYPLYKSGGYIRDAVTGKPVSAPPVPKAPPQEEETPPVDEGLVSLAEAVAAHAERLAALEAAKGGEAK